MDCSDFQNISGLREADLEPAEIEARRTHRSGCPSCARESERDEAIVSLLRRMPDLESDLTADKVLSLARVRTIPAEPAAPRPAEAPRRPRWASRAWPAGLAAAAALALGLLVGRAIPRTAPGELVDPYQGFKGQLEGRVELSLFAEERAGPTAVVEGRVYPREQGFVMLIDVERQGGHLALVELRSGATPELLGDWPVDVGPVELEAEGRPLSFRPDPGATTLMAVLHDGQLDLTAPNLARIAAGEEPVPGLLGVDEARVELERN